MKLPNLGKWEKRLLGAVIMLLVGPMSALALLREFIVNNKLGELKQRVELLNAETPGIKGLGIDEKLSVLLKLNGSLAGGAWVMLAINVGLVALLVFGSVRPLRKSEAISWLCVFFGILGPMSFVACLNALNVAFAFSFLLLILGTMLTFLYGMRRPQTRETTWGEAFAGAAAVFALMGLAYGIVPNQFLFWADNELQWRKDKIGAPTPTGEALFSEGIDFAWFLGDGRGRIIITKETIRDIMVVNLYTAGLVGQFMMFAWWQRRDKGKPKPEIEPTSSYGRPLVRKAQ